MHNLWVFSKLHSSLQPTPPQCQGAQQGLCVDCCCAVCRDGDAPPEVLSWQLMDGQLMHVSLLYRNCEFAGTLMLEEARQSPKPL